MKDDLQKRADEAEEAGDLPLALELWKERSKSDEDGIAFLQSGRIAQELGNWTEAESAYTEALSLQPSSSLAKFVSSPIVDLLMGALWSERTDKKRIESLQTAKKWFLSALEKERSAPCLTLLGAACAKLNDAASAREAFEEAIELNPNYDEAMYNLAAIEEDTDPPKARDLLERAIQIDPDYALAHQMLGRVYVKLKDLVRAEHHYRRCLQIHPSNYWCSLFLAGLLVTRKRDAEAEQIYLHAIELSPEEPGALEFYARFLEKRGRAAEAAEVRARIKPSKRDSLASP
ncbi:MAG: tetratricopeptide repeat protein [Terracidiphilus sp.]|jgi:tetratricopeptide (TPR) repeat protein